MRTYEDICFKKERAEKKWKVNWILIKAKNKLKKKIEQAKQFLKK